MTSHCPWTGQPIDAAKVGGATRKFASPAARNQAHTAARMYTEHLIAAGFLSWEQVRAWFHGRKDAASPPCTAQDAASEPPPAPGGTDGA